MIERRVFVAGTAAVMTTREVGSERFPLTCSWNAPDANPPDSPATLFLTPPAIGRILSGPS